VKIRLSRGKIVSLSFILLSVASAIYVSEITVNYLRFWPALGQLGTQISKVVLTRDANSNQTMLSVHFVVNNPTDYVGFEVWKSSVSLYFLVKGQPNVTLFTNQQLGAQLDIRTPLGANGQTARDQTVPLSTQNSTALWNFKMNNPETLAHVTLTVDIVSFLNPVIGHTHLSDENDFPLSPN
jgi:hypothetical protein